MNELKSKALRSYGYEGSLNDMEDAFYGGSDINTGEMNWLATLGFTQPQLNDRRKAYLTSLGFSGSLNDMLRAALVNDVYYDWGGATLSLNLAASETLDSKITFTRASSALRTNASGVLESVAINVPRIDYDPITHICKGLLIEEARTNIVGYSQQFDSAVWFKNGTTVTANAAIAPDGSMTADLITNTAGAVSLIASSISVTPSSTNDYFASIYVKRGNKSVVTLNAIYPGNSEDNVYFNFDTMGVTAAPYSGQYIFESLGSDWYRIGYRISRDATGTKTAITLRFWNHRGAGVIGDTCHIWGAQLEREAAPSSYIPTTSAAVTRSADLASITGTDFSSWYNQSEGTFVITGDCFAKTDEDNAYITVGDGTSSNFQSVIGNNGGTYQLKLNVYSGGVAQASPATTSNAYLQTGDVIKFAFGYKADDVCLATYLNNTTATDTSATIPTVDRAFIGAYYASGSRILNGHISSIKYYATKLPNKVIRMLGREL